MVAKRISIEIKDQKPVSQRVLILCIVWHKVGDTYTGWEKTRPKLTKKSVRSLTLVKPI